MFNLLPFSEKKEIRKLYMLRRLNFILVLLFATGIVANFLLLPSLLLSQIKYSEVRNEIAFRQESLEDKNTGSLRLAINKAKEEIKILEAVTEDTPTVYDLFSKVVARKNENIKITGILYGANEKEHEVIVNGVSRNREALLEFAENVKREPIFSNVSLPVSNFAKNKDIDFSFSVRGNF